jgi:hypothetical protein
VRVVHSVQTWCLLPITARFRWLGRNRGLKENVIVGRLIPAGTGAVMNLLREVAVKRDALILEEREKNAAAAAEQQPERLPAAE